MKNRLRLSGIGTWLALICAVHCALTPIVISLAPVFAGSLIHSEWLEMLLIGSGFAFASIAILKSYLKDHRRAEPVMIVLISMGLAIFSFLFLPHNLLHAGTFIAASLLIVAHVYNARLVRTCKCAVPAA